MSHDSLKQPCNKCGSVAWERLERKGFFQARILPLFHLYPWRCALCNRVRYLSLRSDPELHLRQLRPS